MFWKSTDPRLEVTGCVAIVVLRPDPLGGWAAFTAAASQEGNFVMTTLKDRPLIKANDTWNPRWHWTYAPPPKDEDPV